MISPLWIVLFFLTAVRLLIAATGSFSGVEAYLIVCAQRLDWGFVEGPAGIPALIRASTFFGGLSPLGVRCLSPFLLLLASFFLSRFAAKSQGTKVAFWSVIVFNLLPLSNVAALVMEGTMVVATFWIMALLWSWSLVRNKNNNLLSWLGFGLLLAVATQISYAIGWLLPLVIVLNIVRRKPIALLGAGGAFLLLALGWVGPLLWNINHDWLQWSQITWGSFWSWSMPQLTESSQSLWCWLLLLSLPFCFVGVIHFIFSSEKKEREDGFCFLALLGVPFLFCFGGIGHDSPSFGLQLALAAMLLPAVVSFFLKTAWSKKIGFLFLLLTGIFSLLMILEIVPSPENSSWCIPSCSGVKGIQKVAAELLRLRALKTEEAAQHPGVDQLPVAQPPFLIAETPELAALLGAVLPIHYPELLGAPSVFTPESPSFSSQFQLWPHYADAVATSVVDPLYTEEPKTSPFLGYDALYITTESAEELPETISGAFATVLPVSEATLQRGKRTEHLIIYECKNYQMLPL